MKCKYRLDFNFVTIFCFFSSANLHSRRQENENKVQQYRQQLGEINSMETTSKHEYNLHNDTKTRCDEQKEEFERKKRAIENQASE